jgi:hypothetical protein
MLLNPRQQIAQDVRRQAAGDRGQTPLNVRIVLNQMGQQQRAGGA